MVFVSYNKKDQMAAQQVAIFLAAENLNVWFDEWEIQAGDSIVSEVQNGLAGCTHFWILWSKNALKSNWVKRELSAVLARAIKSGTPKVIPLRLDNTPLPALLVDVKYLRFHGGTEEDRYTIIGATTGAPPSTNFIKAIVRKYHELTRDENFEGTDPFGYVVACPECGDQEFKRNMWYDPRGEPWFVIECKGCGWSDVVEG